MPGTSKTPSNTTSLSGAVSSSATAILPNPLMPVPGALKPYSSFVAMSSSIASPDLDLFLFELSSGLTPDDGWVSHSELSLAPTGFLDPVLVERLVEDRPVPWENSAAIKDRLNHLLVVFFDGNHGLVYVSDSNLKGRIHDMLLAGEFDEWEPVDESLLITAYLSDKPLRTLWLGGLHRSVDVKADSKILSGKSLGSALDPFGDSTFVAGAARSAGAGVSLKRSGVWFGPQKDWAAFCAVAQKVLQKLSATAAGVLVDHVHPGLAKRCYNLKGISAAYLVEWAASDSVQGRRRASILDNLSNKFAMDVVATKPPSTPTPAVRLSVRNLQTGHTKEFTLTPNVLRGRVNFLVASSKDDFQEWRDAVVADAELLRVYYDSGHTIANSTIGLSAIQDRAFTQILYADFLNGGPPALPFDIDREKPAGANLAAMIPQMLLPGDRSLFQWVFKCGLAQLGLAPLNPANCWLYCDDGSGEIADFIHLHQPAVGLSTITIIHVKAANSALFTRQISASAYEIVLGQATKNLRRILSSTIQEKITTALSKPGPDRTWDSPWPALPTPAAAAGLSAALGAIKTQCNYEVVVVQPHVLKSRYLVGKKPSPARRAVQLRSLLFGTKVMANAAGAKFQVVFDNR